jgi:hypothetical protein
LKKQLLIFNLGLVQGLVTIGGIAMTRLLHTVFSLTTYFVLVANGATGLDGWILTEAQAVSADGQWVVGSGTPPGSFTSSEPFLAFIAPGDPDPSVQLVPAINFLLQD